MLKLFSARKRDVLNPLKSQQNEVNLDLFSLQPLSLVRQIQIFA